ncbi:MAG: GDP-L-fucose synthase [Synergistetes bacterium]|nr:GDP-L-fucose synthase [Synergistota bacterium]MCX8127244.1 GDP-L-fucose synthase [Synergistota bacterium]MDW8191870.1 GDP-L-fucose synthase [Synergistota bacterium]
MKVYIAGHRGLVGSALLKKLKEKGYENILFRSSKELDLRRQSDVEMFFEENKPDQVYLCAAKVGGILANSTFKAEFIYDNLAIALNVIHSSYKFGVKKLLNLGSSCIYPKNSPQPMKEEYLLSGYLELTNEPYAIAKISAIKLCRYYNEQYGTNFISVMPTNLYGPNDNFDLYTSHVLPALIRKFHLGKALEDGDWESIRRDLNARPIEDVNGECSKEVILKILEKYGIQFDKLSLKVNVLIWGSGEVYREFLYVEDLADACVFLMESIDAPEMRKLCPDYFVNVGTGEDIKIKDLAGIVKKIVGFSGEVRQDLSKPDGVQRKLLDVSKIRELGWTPKVGLEEGIKRTYEWYIGV